MRVIANNANQANNANGGVITRVIARVITNNANQANNANSTMNGEDKKIILPELSYKIVGAAFKVFNELGWGLPEKDYQRALEVEFRNVHLSFEREKFIPLEYLGEKISKYFADFIVEKEILVELKVVSKLGYDHAKQVLAYLNSANLRLGILLYFTKDGVKYRRVVNPRFKD